jgi:hypothetical protein
MAEAGTSASPAQSKLTASDVSMRLQQVLALLFPSNLVAKAALFTGGGGAPADELGAQALGAGASPRARHHHLLWRLWPEKRHGGHRLRDVDRDLHNIY